MQQYHRHHVRCYHVEKINRTPRRILRLWRLMFSDKQGQYISLFLPLQSTPCLILQLHAFQKFFSLRKSIISLIHGKGF